MNIKMRSSDVFKDKTPPEEVDVEDEKAMEPFKFKWHCQKGIIENALKLNIEFNESAGQPHRQWKQSKHMCRLPYKDSVDT